MQVLLHHMISEEYLDPVFLYSVFHGKSKKFNCLLTISEKGHQLYRRMDDKSLMIFPSGPKLVDDILLRKTNLILFSSDIMDDDASDNDEDKVMKAMTVIQHRMVIIRYQEILGGMAQGKLF